MKKVFLDAGHGGKDPGGVGNGLREKDISLSVTMKVGKILKQHGVVVGYSRTTDIFITLGERSNMANRFSADLFLSIHCNAFGDGSASGVEVYSYLESKKGAELSKDIYENIIADKAYTQKRGVKTANFSVIKNTIMPAALVELGFITNQKDANILKDRQDDLAKALAKGILKNLGVEYVEKKQEMDNPKDSLDTLYRVQVGVFKDKKNADALVKELKVKGYDAMIV